MMPAEKFFTSISKPDFDLPYPAVEVLDPRRPADLQSSTEEHRHVCADDNAHGGDGTDYSPPRWPPARLPPGITNQQRQE